VGGGEEGGEKERGKGTVFSQASLVSDLFSSSGGSAQEGEEGEEKKRKKERKGKGPSTEDISI